MLNILLCSEKASRKIKIDYKILKSLPELVIGENLRSLGVILNWLSKTEKCVGCSEKRSESRGCLVVSAFVPEASGAGSSLGRERDVLILSKTF